MDGDYSDVISELEAHFSSTQGGMKQYFIIATLVLFVVFVVNYAMSTSVNIPIGCIITLFITVGIIYLHKSNLFGLRR